MLPNSPYAIAYHRFDGLSEIIRGVEWSVLAGDASIGVGRVGGSLVPDTVALVGAPSTSYGTLHGSEALSVSAWTQGMSERDANVFFGFLDADRNPSNGIRIIAEPTADEVFFPMWVELLNSRVAYRFPVPISDLDSESDPNPGVPHLLVVQVRRNPAGGWWMGFATDGGGILDGGTVDAPRIPGSDIDLPSQVPDDESTFGVLTSGVALDEFAFWSDAPPMRRVHSSRIHALWSEFRSPMDSYTDRFGEERHDPFRRQRGSLGTPCRVNIPPSIEGPESMFVESGSLARQNEIELFANDPDGGEVRWSVASGGSLGTVEIHRHPRRKDAILVRYAPDGPGSLVVAELNTCVRDIAPNDYTPGAPTTVTLTCTIDITETSTYIVDDTYPAGWTISDISPGGVDNGTSVRWFFLDNTNRVLSYDATPPALETGLKSFSGTIDSDGPAGFQSFPVGGETTTIAATTTVPPTTTPAGTTLPPTTAPGTTTTVPGTTVPGATTTAPSTTVPGGTTTAPAGIEDDFVIRAESRCGLFDEVQVKVTIV